MTEVAHCGANNDSEATTTPVVSTDVSGAGYGADRRPRYCLEGHRPRLGFTYRFERAPAADRRRGAGACP